MSYRIEQAVKFEEIINKSRFLSYLLPVQDADHALQLIEEYSIADASHNCWAFKAGDVYRFSDDGEPSGTAGKPMLNILEGNQLDYCLALVIRWYGGVKLGTGGLIRAYSQGIKECIKLANISPYIPQQTLIGFWPYSLLDILKSRLENFNAHIVDENYKADGVSLTIELPKQQTKSWQSLAAELSHGQHHFHTAEEQ